MTDDSPPITFTAAFPAIASAIIVSGDGNGLRLKLDVPETDLLAALHTLALRQTAFQVTITPLDDDASSTIGGLKKPKF